MSIVPMRAMPKKPKEVINMRADIKPACAEKRRAAKR